MWRDFEMRRKENGTNQTKGKFYMSWYRTGRSMRESCSGRREHTRTTWNEIETAMLPRRRN